jgi:uncharacterized YkwD family protein
LKTYQIVSGDTLYSIARRNNITLSELLNANPNLTNYNYIYPGQTIYIPSMTVNDEPITAGNYIIKVGDTLYSIARKNNITLGELLEANPSLSASGYIYPGQNIYIPSGSNNKEQGSQNKADNALVNEVIRLVNSERSKIGVSALKKNKQLDEIAQMKSQDFINNNYLSHTSPIYGSPFEMMQNQGVKFTSAAENIASGQSTPAQVMNSWMNSSGHRANILNQNYNQIGVGIAEDKNGKRYWTQLFIRN